MTAAEMITYFDLLYDVGGSASVAGFTDSEKFGFLNKAQEAVVTEFCMAKDWDMVRELFGNETYDLTLSSLLEAGTYGTVCYVTEAIDPDYLYYITSRTQLTRTFHPTISSAEWLENIKIPLEQIKNFENSTVNKTIFYHPRVVDLKQLLSVKQISTVTLSGAGGTCTMTCAGVTSKTVTYTSSLPVSAANFVSANYATYYSAGVAVSCDGNDIIFTALVAGIPFAIPVVTPGVEGSHLHGTVVQTVSIVTNVESNMFMVFVDDLTTATTFYIHYVKKPTDIGSGVDCALREELHRTIVEKAVQLAMITIADPRIMATLKQNK